MRMGGDNDFGPKMIESFGRKQKEYNDEMARREVLMREEFQNKLDKKEEELRQREEAVSLIYFIFFLSFIVCSFFS